MFGKYLRHRSDDALVVCINHNIPMAGRKMQPVIIRFAFIAPFVMPLFQRLLRAGECKSDGFIILRRDPLQDAFPDHRIREHN